MIKCPVMAVVWSVQCMDSVQSMTNICAVTTAAVIAACSHSSAVTADFSALLLYSPLSS